MVRANRYASPVRLWLLLSVVLVSGCALVPGQTGVATSSIANVVKPCDRQFYPQTTVSRVVTQAAADSLYFVSGVHLFAVNAGNGALQWCLLISNVQSQLSQQGAVLEGRTLGPPAPLDGLEGLAVQNGRIFVTSANYFTYAFATASGKLIWQRNTGVFNGIPAVSGTTVYIPSRAGMSALSTQDGSQRWSSTVANTRWRPVIVNNTLYTGLGDTVSAVDTATGKARWIYHAAGEDGVVYVAPIVDDGVVYTGIGSYSDPPQVLALDAATGKLLWQTSMTVDSMAQLVVADGVLYTSGHDSLLGLNPRNGTVIWSSSGSGVHDAAFLASGDVLYTAVDSGDLYAFDTQTHKLIWHERLRALGAGEVSGMKLIGDELYVGFNDLGQNQFASIHAINTQTGSEDWSAKVNWNVSTLDLA